MSEEILAKGRFRVDRRRALEKMERFQLADPRAYTVELVAAAVAAGATRIDVRNDSDDFELSWEGEGPTREELDGIFDHLFAKPATPRAEMLQHLAIGVLGALGQAPKWVRIDRGGTPPLRLHVEDPAETLAVEQAHGVAGTHVHVRQRFSAKTLAEALMLPLVAPEETRFLRDAARWCPVPLYFGGKLLVGPKPPPSASTLPDGGGVLWLRTAPGARVDIVRRGVIVGRIERPVGGMSAEGWIRGDGLTLDASRGNVVEDAAWTLAGKALDAAVEGLLARFAAGVAQADAGPPTPGNGEDALEQRAHLLDAAGWLKSRKLPLGRYAALRLVQDLGGRWWSADELAAFEGRKGTLTEPGLYAEGDGAVIFAAADAPALDVLCPGLPDLTEPLRVRAQGRDRRRRAAAGRRPPEFVGAPHQLPFVEGPLRGSVRFREKTDLPDLLVELRVDGMAVEQVVIPSPAGAMEAILDHPGFTTDEGFTHVTEDATRKAAEAVLRARAVAFAVSHVDRLARGATLAPSGPAVLTAALRACGAKAREDLGALLRKHPEDPLLRARGLVCGDGRRLSVPDVLESAQEWILVTTVPRDCPPSVARAVLVFPEELLPAWLGWLGTAARDGRGTLADDIRGAARRASPKRTAALDGAARVRVAVATDGYTGELGFDGTALDPRIELLRDGVPVCTVTAALGLPGLVGVLDHPTFPVNRAHDAPADAETVTRLAKALRPAVDALARLLWDAAGDRPLSDALLGWIAARGADTPDWADARPLARTVAGAPVTLAALQARASDKKAARIKLLPKPPGEVPGFDDSVVVTPALQRALEAVAPRAVRAGDAELFDATRHLAAYLERPRVADPAVLAERAEEDGGVRVRWVLLADPDRVGVMRVEARWRDRVLAARDRGESLGVLAIVEGEGITPSAALTELREPQRLHPYLKKARTQLDDVATAALDALDEAGGEVPAAQRATWRGLLARLEGASDRTRAETAILERIAALRLYTRLDGERVSRADLVAAREAGPVWHVPTDTPAGPTDTPWYLRDEPWTIRSLGALSARVGSGAAALAAWREGEARRRALGKREPIVTEDVFARAPLAAPGIKGEVALRPLAGGARGLEILPLVDGLPLDPLVVPFSAPATAILTGPSVRADRAFRTWAAGSDLDAAKAAVIAAARALAADVVARVAQAGLTGASAAPADAAWAVAYTTGDDAGPAVDLPVFQLHGGAVVSATTLDLRNRNGGVGFVGPGAPPFVAGAPPLVAPRWLRDQLALRFNLVDLGPVALRHATRLATGPAPAPATRYTVVSADAHVGLGDLDAVEVRRQGVTLVTLPANGPVPIVGWVEAPSADVDPLWKGLLPVCEGPVRHQLLDRARDVLARMLAEAEGAPAGGAIAAPLRASLLASLDAVTAAVRDDEALARRLADPLLARLAALPLFRDCTGAFGPLAEVVARATVRVVEPGVTGTPMASRGRVWALGARERALVERLRKLQDAAEALQEETRGQARRLAARGPAPALPKDTPVEAVTIAGGGGALWLQDPQYAARFGAGRGVAVRVDGATVELITPVPGLLGFVEGPFETDAAFEHARLDADAQVALRGAATALLQREAASHPARLAERLGQAFAACGHDLDTLLAAPLSPWESVAILADTTGQPLDLRWVKGARKSWKRLLVGPVGAASPRKGERVVAGDDATLATLRGWFRSLSIEHVDEERVRREARRRDEEAKRASGVRGKRERALAERAAKLLTKWTGTPAPGPAIDALIQAWAAGKRPAWPPFDTAEAEGPWPALVAFAVGTAVATTPAAHLVLVAGLADTLGSDG